MKQLLLIFTAFLLISCSKKDGPYTSNDNAKLVGIWESISVKDGQTIGRGEVTFLSESQQHYDQINGSYYNLFDQNDPPSDTGDFYYIYGKDGKLNVAGSGEKWLSGTVTSFSTSKVIIKLSNGGSTTLTPKAD